MRAKYAIWIYSHREQYESEVGGAYILIDDYEEVKQLIDILLGTRAVIVVETVYETIEA